MKYFYVLFLLAGSISLQASANSFNPIADNSTELFVDEFRYSSVSFMSDDCGMVNIDGWSSWSGGSCTGYCYDTSSDCGSFNISGANAPNGLLNGDGTISIRYVQSLFKTNLSD